MTYRVQPPGPTQHEAALALRELVTWFIGQVREKVPGFCEGSGRVHVWVFSVLQYCLVALEHTLGNLWSSALQRDCVVWVSCLHPELSQHPDAISEFHRLIQHVLTLHCAFGYGEDIATLQFVGNCI